MSINAMPRRPQYDDGFNDTGSTISAFLIVELDDDGLSIVKAAGVDSIPYGVTAADIADQERGNVQTEGWVPVLAGTAGMTAGTLVMPEAGGTGFGVDISGSAGDNKGVLGLCVQSASSGKLGLVKIGVHQTQVAD
jgi:hypothetical protein